MESLIEEAKIQPEETVNVKEGKNFVNTKAKVIKLTGDVKCAEVYAQKDSYVESIDFSGITAQDLYFCVEQCNKYNTGIIPE